jgi:hypothetical protein
MRAGRVLRLGGVLVAAVTLAGCAIGPADGENLARDAADQAAERLNDDLGHRERVRSAEQIAATEVQADGHSDGRVQMTPLAWEGRTAGDEKATIDVRFVAAVAGRGADTVGDRGNSAGAVTQCYRYTLQLYRYTEYEEIDCPKVARPPVPSASPVLTLPRDAAKRLEAALRDATPETLAGAVRGAFPQEGIGVDTVTSNGTLVAAVGVAAERDCVVMIRTADGKTREVAFDRIQLEPGETGCRTALYTSPAR